MAKNKETAVVETAETPVLIPEPNNVVTLGTGEGAVEYTVYGLPWARLKKARKFIVDTVGEVFERLAELQATEVGGDDLDAATGIMGQVDDLLGLVMDRVPEAIEMLIPSVDMAIFDDEDHGPTTPQLIKALEVAVRANGWDRIPNVFRQVARVR